MMGTIVKFKDGQLKKLEIAVKDKMNRALSDTSLMVDIGKYVKDNIVGEARLGKGYSAQSSRKVDDRGDNVSALSPLKKTTIERREKISKLNQIGISFNPKKSNLTLSGQTLQSISFEVSSTKPLLKITADGTHKGYIQKNGNRSKGAAFKDILRWQAEKGRNIFGISERMYRTIFKKIKSGIRRNLE